MTKSIRLRLMSVAVVAGLATSPAIAQRQTHSAGVSWTGGHGGVSWDGGHAYEGGSYGGYPAASSPSPAYKPPPPAYKMPQPYPGPNPVVDPRYAKVHARGNHRDPGRDGEVYRRR